MSYKYQIPIPSKQLSGFTDDVFTWLNSTAKKVDESLGIIQRIDGKVEEIKPWIPVIAVGIVLVAVGLFYVAERKK